MISLLLFFLLFNQSVPGQFKVSSSVIGSGGERISSAGLTLYSTAGEVFTGESMNSSSRNYAGFWYVYNNSIITGAAEEETVPAVFHLGQNYPNPFNPSTTLKFGLAEGCHVTIKIYNILGSEVETLADNKMEAGWYNINFNASGLATGTYIYRMQAGTFTSTKKMLLIK